MSYVKSLSPALQQLIRSQDGLVTAEQLHAHDFDRSAVYRRIKSGHWQRLLPTVVLTTSGSPTRRQLIIAAYLYAGSGAAIDGVDASAFYGSCPPPPYDAPVHVVIPEAGEARSREFVRVRRAMAEIQIGARTAVAYVDAATALVVAARNSRDDRAAIALLSRGLQLGHVDVAALARAREAIGHKWCRPADRALAAVGVGLRSPAENDYRCLILTSRILPEPRWNQWLELPDGGPPICVDCLWEEAGMVGEVIGRTYHAWGQAYEDSNARAERVVANGLIVCETTPIRLRREGPVVRRSLESTYLIHNGRGMPPGIRLIEPPDWLRNRSIAG